ncbi:RsmB/NOP family class I SAM-dependent RNA methyltransferase [Ruegeria arenilitoris]|uniref:RsmB/NOP family class I SAM-dependent RNA methyltransferase n=1 Tax=Ruegeria arenilitoris TaxID=1173585 RepID=UPI0014804A04|nr:RsmB/NOP family class I SAM-dependent RNA methyltransferase [Ruegeria arenilitoris]
MTPAARIQASIEILDEILAGAPVEKSLTNWARRSRFAGSKDRAAVRDHVFTALRCKRSYAALGGAETGRGLMIGAVRASGESLEELFSGTRHAPEVLTDNEVGCDFASKAEQYDIPDWLWPRFETSLGDQAVSVAKALQSRAPVHLRVNLIKADVPKAIEALAADGIITAAHPACDTALEVTEGARKIAQSRAYADGLVELQDAASQAVVAALDLRPGMRVLDYCAGGGGKSLALAARKGVSVFAHDVNATRMRDLPARAERAGARVEILATKDIAQRAPFDIILADAPCSGSGSWRRAPAGKWALTESRLQELSSIQAAILAQLSPVIAPGGILAYATCSMLDDENGNVVDAFLRKNPVWTEVFRKSWLVSHGTDGFFTSHLTR